MIDKQRFANNLRQHVQRRLGNALGCKPEDFENLKLGNLLHLCFLVHGDLENISGFSCCMATIVELLGGQDLLWVEPKRAEEQPAEKVVVN